MRQQEDRQAHLRHQTTGSAWTTGLSALGSDLIGGSTVWQQPPNLQPNQWRGQCRKAFRSKAIAAIKVQGCLPQAYRH